MKKYYNEEFKAEAVALVMSSDTPISQIALDLGVNQVTLGNWVRKAMNQSDQPGNKKRTKKDYQALERELRKAKKELDLRNKEIAVLKKATAYFAKDQV